MRKVYKIEIVCSTRRDIFTELKIDQDVQGQRGSYHQHQLGFPHHLGAPGKHFGEIFNKIEVVGTTREDILTDTF